MNGRDPVPDRSSFRFFSTIGTRWMDMDIYGHVNNVQYYSYFDTAIAELLMSKAGFDPWKAPVIGYCAQSTCRFHQSIVVPDHLTVAIAVARLGTRSVTYQIGIFKNDDSLACADGQFVHVFVDRSTERPTDIPGHIRAALEPYMHSSAG